MFFKIREERVTPNKNKPLHTVLMFKVLVCQVLGNKTKTYGVWREDGLRLIKCINEDPFVSVKDTKRVRYFKILGQEIVKRWPQLRTRGLQIAYGHVLKVSKTRPDDEVPTSRRRHWGRLDW